MNALNRPVVSTITSLRGYSKIPAPGIHPLCENRHPLPSLFSLSPLLAIIPWEDPLLQTFCKHPWSRQHITNVFHLRTPQLMLKGADTEPPLLCLMNTDMNTALRMSARNHGALCYHPVFTSSSKSIFYIQNMANSGLLQRFALLYLCFQYLQTKVPKPKCPNRCSLRAAAAFTCPQSSEPSSALSCPLKDASASTVSL